MANTSEDRNREPRLARVELPGMNVKSARHATLLGGDESGMHECVWKMPEVRTTGRRQNRPAHIERRGWDFVECSRFEVELIGIPPAPDEPISFSLNGEETGIVPVLLLEQDLERPLAPADDREARRPIAEDFLAGDIFEQVLRVPH